MADRPLASVITATRGDCPTLWDRCIPSIEAQTLPTEHLIVSEACPRLRLALPLRSPRIRYAEVGPWNRDPQLPLAPGAMAYLVGTQIAFGDYIGFCGDDDELLPHHMETAIRRIQAEEADFATSIVDFRVNGESRGFVGDRSRPNNKVDTIAIVAKGECFYVANWRQDAGDTTDQDLVEQWEFLGLKRAYVDEVTCVHHDGWFKAALVARGVKV